MFCHFYTPSRQHDASNATAFNAYFWPSIWKPSKSQIHILITPLCRYLQILQEKLILKKVREQKGKLSTTITTTTKTYGYMYRDLWCFVDFRWRRWNSTLMFISHEHTVARVTAELAILGPRASMGWFWDRSHSSPTGKTHLLGLREMGRWSHISFRDLR